MNKTKLDIFLERCALALPLAIAIRWIVARTTNTPYFSINSPFELIAYMILGLFAGISVWHLFFRRKCKKCKSTKWTLVNSREIDRWTKIKKIEINTRNHQGKITGSREKAIPVICVKLENEYLCKMCHNRWIEHHTIEKTKIGNSMNIIICVTVIIIIIIATVTGE